MRDDLSSPDHLSSAAQGTTAVLGEVSMLVELTWASARECSACPADRRGHGGATGSGGCVVGAARVAAHQDGDALHRVVDLLWQQLHRGRPRRMVNWYAPATRHALQLHDLRAWNDRAERSAGEVAALVRATLRTAQHG